MAPRKEGLAPREEGRAPREKGQAGSEEGRPRLRGHRRRRRGARPGGARGRRREGASAWRVGGARSALEGRAERGGDRGQGWGSRSGARSRCRSNPKDAVGLATPRVGVGPARGIGDRRARGANVAPLGADCTMSIVRTHASGGVSRENAGAMWARRCEARVHSDRTCAVGRPTGSRCV